MTDTDDAYSAIKANLFPASHAAIGDWDKFPWHRDRSGNIQTYKLESSQALAIDVFGTIKVHDECDRVLGKLARECGVPDRGPWRLELEWVDSDRLLREPRPTQVDAIAFGADAILIIECKFTEPGGGCSQVEPIRKGAHRGFRQCNGDYITQVNPANGITARCSLAGKGILYWDTIPELFGLDASHNHTPCPFKGDSYQWMRNVVLADRLASARGSSGATIAAYADAGGLPTAEKVRVGVLGHKAASGVTLVKPFSYQSIVARAQSISDRPNEWRLLAEWVMRKIDTVAQRLGTPSTTS